MKGKQTKREKALQKEWKRLEAEEARLAQAAQRARPAQWRLELEQKVPQKVRQGLQAAFCRGFALVFQQGKVVIERGIDRQSVQADHDIRHFAVQRKGGVKELRAMRRGAGRADLANLALTTAEGLGLGALGIGMPDIVLFLGTLLKGIYETALHYGFDYESRREQLRILRMMAAALSTGPEWTARNRAAELPIDAEPTEEDFQTQLRQTAACFATDMLLLKFLQGLPVVGILGGAANPVYYRRVLKYVQLKYRRRYLQGLSAKDTP